jgi:hypothetical protein
VWLDGDHLELTGPCGPAPWLLELGRADHAVEVVTRIVRDVIGEPLLVHSTSWRRDRDADDRPRGGRGGRDDGTRPPAPQQVPTRAEVLAMVVVAPAPQDSADQ